MNYVNMAWNYLTGVANFYGGIYHYAKSLDLQYKLGLDGPVSGNVSSICIILLLLVIFIMMDTLWLTVIIFGFHALCVYVFKWNPATKKDE